MTTSTHRIRRRISAWLFVCLLGLFPGIGCGIGTTVTTTLPPVDAMDDEAATPRNVPVEIFVLSNDLQDDDLVTDITQAIDDLGATQSGSVEIDILSFPERIIYTPPTDFIGEVTFTYDITALGTQYDYTTTDTATVTVAVLPPGEIPVIAVNDMAVTIQNEPVTIDVLMNDIQDSNAIETFGQAFFGLQEQPNSVSSVLQGGRDQLVYTPPAGFTGDVDIQYTIMGTGIHYMIGSVDNAQATVIVRRTPAIVQFEDASGEMFEILLFFAGEESFGDPPVTQEMPTAAAFSQGQITTCFELEPGLDIPIRATILFDDRRDIDGVCPEFVPGMSYTVVVQPIGAGPDLEVVCLPGLVNAALCTN